MNKLATYDDVIGFELKRFGFEPFRTKPLTVDESTI